MARPVQILLTATVTPLAGINNSVVNDPGLRATEYERVLRSMMPIVDAGARLTFAENSGADLAPFAAVAAGRAGVELLNVHAPSPAEDGKGSAEMRLVAQAVRDSALLRVGASDTMLWKVTGRYQVRNLSRVMASAPDVDLYVNLRSHPGTYMDMWVWGGTRTGVELLLEHVDELSETRKPFAEAEQRFYHVVRQLVAEGKSVCPRFKVEPRLSGTRGWDGRSYDSPQQRAKWATRMVMRRIAPTLWI